MSARAQNTRTPWRLEKGPLGKTWVVGENGIGGEVTVFEFFPSEEADAVFIVRAANAYDGLLHACREALRRGLSFSFSGKDDADRVEDLLKAALDKAEARP